MATFYDIQELFSRKIHRFQNAIGIFLASMLRCFGLQLLILVFVTLYFLLFAAFASLVIFAPARDFVSRTAGRLVSSIATSSKGTFLSALGSSLSIIGSMSRMTKCALTSLYEKRKMIAVGVLAVLAPSLLVSWLSNVTVFDFVEDQSPPDTKIALLLAGERLSAPPPLAPEIFTTREVELVRPATSWGSRDWALLDDDFRQRLLSIFMIMRERHGYEMVMLEGYRSPERQAALAAMGQTVTQAAPGQSYHQHGLAADSAFLRNGQLVISEQDAWAMRGYQLYGELANEMGLTWGGEWRMRDYGHVELRIPGVLRRIEVPEFTQSAGLSNQP